MIVEAKRIQSKKTGRRAPMAWRQARTSGIVPLPTSMSTTAPLPAVPATGGP
jgi:hypothetical protein